MDIQLIAMDLDGTALRADRDTFSPRLERALLEAHRRGVAVAPITGRQFAMLPPALRRGAAWEHLAVLCNGGEVRRLMSGEVLCAHYFTAGELLPLVEAAQRLELPIELSSNGTLYLTGESWRRQRLAGDTLNFHLDYVLQKHGQVVEDLGSFCRTFPHQIEKVNLPYVPDTRRKEVESMLPAFSISWFWASAISIEITHAQATKAKGMYEVCRLLGIDPAHTLALGDSGNDIPMLKAAGLGVAMGGAPAEVQAAAGAVTASNAEDGAALAVERYVLDREPARAQGI